MVTLPIEEGLVRLRRLSVQDAARYIALEASTEEKKFVGGPKNKTIEEIEAYVRTHVAADDLGVLIVEERNTGEFLGRAGLLPHGKTELEVHCVLKKEAQGKGYGTAAFRGLIRLADALAKQPVAVLHPENVSSQRLFEKLGFARVETATANGWQDGHFIFRRRVSA